MSKYPLPFDFYIENNYKKAVIECQGLQHYKPISFFGEKDGFEYRKNNDKIKKDYCLTHNIVFIEIPYYAYDNEDYKNILERNLL